MKIKILLVEDQNSFLFRQVLSAINGFEFVTVKRGDQALPAFLEHRPDLVLTDLRLPRLHGNEVIRAIRRHDVRVPIIAITAHSDGDSKGRALAAGANEVYLKPLDYHRLYSRINELIALAIKLPEDEHRQRLTLNKQRRLNRLLEKKALMGIETPASVTLEIEDLKNEIGRAD